VLKVLKHYLFCEKSGGCIFTEKLGWATLNFFGTVLAFGLAFFSKRIC